jgi:hypothetical protein
MLCHLVHGQQALVAGDVDGDGITGVLVGLILQLGRYAQKSGI